MPKNDIEALSPPGTFKPTGPWSLGVRAGDFVFVAGMRGIDPNTNMLVEGDEARVRQAFINMKTIIEAAGGTLRDTVRLVVYVTDMNRHRPLVNSIQEEFWNGGPYPPRTIVEARALNQGDIVEVEGTFYCPMQRAGYPKVQVASEEEYGGLHFADPSYSLPNSVSNSFDL